MNRLTIVDVLIVIDMQKALFQTPRYNSCAVIANINQLSTAVRNNAGKVIFIQHNGHDEEGLTPHTEGWSILDELEKQPVDIVVEKTICDSFHDTVLSQVLTTLAPDRIIITGCATDFCVDTTLRSAVSHNFNVVAITDAHTTADRPHLDAKSIIDHHNWSWANLITPKTPVVAMTTNELLAEMNNRTH